MQKAIYLCGPQLWPGVGLSRRAGSSPRPAAGDCKRGVWQVPRAVPVPSGWMHIIPHSHRGLFCDMLVSAVTALPKGLKKKVNVIVSPGPQGISCSGRHIFQIAEDLPLSEN